MQYVTNKMKENIHDLFFYSSSFSYLCNRVVLHNEASYLQVLKRLKEKS